MNDDKITLVMTMTAKAANGVEPSISCNRLVLIPLTISATAIIMSWIAFFSPPLSPSSLSLSLFVENVNRRKLRLSFGLFCISLRNKANQEYIHSLFFFLLSPSLPLLPAGLMSPSNEDKCRSFRPQQVTTTERRG